MPTVKNIEVFVTREATETERSRCKPAAATAPPHNADEPVRGHGVNTHMSECWRCHAIIYPSCDVSGYPEPYVCPQCGAYGSV